MSWLDFNQVQLKSCAYTASRSSCAALCVLCSLAEEVIAAAGLEESARAAEIDAASAREDAAAAEQQLLACTEMLGEKEERLEELKAELQDVKQLYKDQTEFMVEQLAHLTQQGYVSSPFKQVQEDRTVSQSQSPHGQDATAS